jgi:hypothetical protein
VVLAPHITRARAAVDHADPSAETVGESLARLLVTIWEEKKRERLIRAEGLGMSRIIFDDFWGSARARALSRLGAEYELTATQLGTVLPDHLERFAPEMAGRRTA